MIDLCSPRCRCLKLGLECIPQARGPGRPWPRRPPASQAAPLGRPEPPLPPPRAPPMLARQTSPGALHRQQQPPQQYDHYRDLMLLSRAAAPPQPPQQPLIRQDHISLVSEVRPTAPLAGRFAALAGSHARRDDRFLVRRRRLGRLLPPEFCAWRGPAPLTPSSSTTRGEGPPVVCASRNPVEAHQFLPRGNVRPGSGRPAVLLGCLGLGTLLLVPCALTNAAPRPSPARRTIIDNFNRLGKGRDAAGPFRSVARPDTGHRALDTMSRITGRRARPARPGAARAPSSRCWAFCATLDAQGSAGLGGGVGVVEPERAGAWPALDTVFGGHDG
jgi:hypothetical protein